MCVNIYLDQLARSGQRSLLPLLKANKPLTPCFSCRCLRSTIGSDAPSSPDWRQYVATTWSEAHPDAPNMESYPFKQDGKPPKDEKFSSFQKFRG